MTMSVQSDIHVATALELLHFPASHSGQLT